MTVGVREIDRIRMILYVVMLIVIIIIIIVIGDMRDNNMNIERKEKKKRRYAADRGHFLWLLLFDSSSRHRYARGVAVSNINNT